MREVPGSNPGSPTHTDIEAETLRAEAGARRKSNSVLYTGVSFRTIAKEQVQKRNKEFKAFVEQWLY